MSSGAAALAAAVAIPTCRGAASVYGYMNYLRACACVNGSDCGVGHATVACAANRSSTSAPAVAAMAVTGSYDYCTAACCDLRSPNATLSLL
ncbi:hypothetical protein JKP88DRAFT_227012 [Tribonema minus]|uniref:Uncharacterized protein n=1 Tax=Tribonema minus TaxID=303371 RepID=A0A836C9T1_9STRA|nr:hypothetical protein JKP88DRAFT_227012 [Tribonema minus]